MKTCLFCGSDNFDPQGKCCVCNHSAEDGTLAGEKVSSYRRRALLCPDYITQFILILIPAISIFFLGVLLLLGHFSDSFLLMELPSLKNCYLLALLCLGGGGFMAYWGYIRFHIGRKAHEVYCEIILQDDNAEQQSSFKMGDYYAYQRFSRRLYFLLLLIPMVLYPFLTSFCYYGANYSHLTVLNMFRISLPDMGDAAGFKFFMYTLPIVSMLFHLADIIFSFTIIVKMKVEEKVALKLNAFTPETTDIPAEEPAVIQEPETYANTEEVVPVEEVPTTHVPSDIPFAFEDLSAFAAIPVSHDIFKHLKELDNAHTETPEAPTAEMSLSELCKRMKLCLINRGIVMDEEQVIALVSSMAAYRLISVATDSECRDAVISAVAECFGCNSFEEIAPSVCESEQDLLFKETEEGKEETAYLQGLYDAHHNANHACVVAIKAVSPAISRVMPAFSTHSRLPEKACTLNVIKDNSTHLPNFLLRQSENDISTEDVYMYIPKNTWCLLAASDEDVPYVPTDMLVTGNATSVVLRCHMYQNGDPKYVIEGDPISYGHFMETIKLATQTAYLSEDHWKKFDKLEEFLKARIGFTFGNRLYRKIEIFTDTYLGCGGDVNHAIDLALVNVLASVLSDCCTEVLNPSDGKIGLFELMDKTFGSDNIPACHELLKAFGLEA